MWDTIDQVRNSICGYEDEILTSDTKNKEREASRIAMLKLYARRRRQGLNAHGQPYKNRGRKSKTGLSVLVFGRKEYYRKWKLINKQQQ